MRSGRRSLESAGALLATKRGDAHLDQPVRPRRRAAAALLGWAVAGTSGGALVRAPPAIASGDATGTVDDSAQASPTPEFFDVNKYRADPGNPGAIRVPGTNIALYIGGFAQLDVLSDVDVIGNQDQFVVSSIPVGPSTGNTGFELSAR